MLSICALIGMYYLLCTDRQAVPFYTRSDFTKLSDYAVVPRNGANDECIPMAIRIREWVMTVLQKHNRNATQTGACTGFENRIRVYIIILWLTLKIGDCGLVKIGCGNDMHLQPEWVFCRPLWAGGFASPEYSGKKMTAFWRSGGCYGMLLLQKLGILLLLFLRNPKGVHGLQRIPVQENYKARISFCNIWMVFRTSSNSGFSPKIMFFICV